MCAASTPATLTARQGRSLGNNTCSLRHCLARPCRAREGSEGVRGMQDTPVCPFTSRFLALRSEALRCWRRHAFSERGCFGVRCRLSLQMSLVATAPTLSSEQGKSFGNCNCSPQQCLVRGGSEGVWGMQDTPVCPFPGTSCFSVLRLCVAGVVRCLRNSAVAV